MSETMQIYASADNFMLMKVIFSSEGTLKILFFYVYMNLWSMLKFIIIIYIIKWSIGRG